MKIPKYLKKPVEDWTQIEGMKRACKVLDIQASLYKEHGGGIERYHALKEVSDALKASINKGNPVSESDYLNWGQNE